jgi:cytidylate kinase
MPSTRRGAPARRGARGAGRAPSGRPSGRRSRRRGIVVAIDGPAGSGKTTVARGVARALGLRRLDTGAMYRALTLAALGRGLDPSEGDALARLARRLRIDVEDGRVRLDGVPVGRALRSAAVNAAVSEVAAHPAVRRELVRRQRRIVAGGNVVVEGRDIGTVVAPNADVKVFLTAAPDERARRRHRELRRAGARVAYARLRRELARRDALDSTREASPLVRAPDAHVIDSTALTPRQVVAEIVRLVRERLGPEAAPRAGGGRPGSGAGRGGGARGRRGAR